MPKRILLWDPRFPDRPPTRLTLDDAIASAAVRAGVAAAADPAEQGLLGGGAPISAASPMTVLLQHGANGNRLTPVVLPLAVAQVAAGLGLAAGEGLVAAPALPSVTLVASVAADEGNSGTKAFTYFVALSAPAPAGGVVVPWSLAHVSTDAADIAGPTSGNVTIAGGASSGSFSISVVGDTTVELTETFTITITAPAGYGPGASMSAVGTILNDDVVATVPANAVSIGNMPLQLTDQFLTIGA